MLTDTRQRQHMHGFTVLELMIGLLVSSLLVGSAIVMLSSSVKNNQDTMNAIRLNQELQGVLELMAGEIRRAGYWANANTDVANNTNSNPFMQSTSDISVNSAKNCILLSYDNNSDGSMSALNSSGDDERYGYRLSQSSIQARPSSAPFSCDSPANAWEDITDSNAIVITQLQFDKSESALDLDGSDPGTAAIIIRNIDITLTGHHVNHPNVSKTLSYRVRLRNDKFIP